MSSSFWIRRPHENGRAVVATLVHLLSSVRASSVPFPCAACLVYINRQLELAAFYMLSRAKRC